MGRCCLGSCVVVVKRWLLLWYGSGVDLSVDNGERVERRGVGASVGKRARSAFQFEGKMGSSSRPWRCSTMSECFVLFLERLLGMVLFDKCTRIHMLPF
jgi:hypothetical protein